MSIYKPFLLITLLTAVVFTAHILAISPGLTAVISGTAASGMFIGLLLLDRRVRIRRSELLTQLSMYRNFSAREFETAVMELFQKSGYQARRTGRSGDRGIDIMLRGGGERIAVQCKHYKNPVGPSSIREFAGALEGSRLRRGIFVTTSSYTQGARQTAQRSRYQIELLDGRDLGRALRNIDKSLETSLIPTQRWHNLPAFWKILSLGFLALDIGAVTGGIIYWVLGN